MGSQGRVYSDPPLASDPDHRTLDQLCEELQKSRASVYRWMQKGMPSYRVLGERVFRWSEVQSWVKANASN